MSDAASQLQAALAPKTGMRRIPFPLESYQHPSPPLSAKRLLNLMAEPEPADARSQAALIPTPGLWVPENFVGQFGAGPVLAINTDMPGVAYFVSGTHAYGFSGVVWDMGDVGTASTTIVGNESLLMPATIAVSPEAVVFCIPPNAYTAPHVVGSTANQIGGTFPGAQSVTYLNNYFIFGAVDFGRTFFISNIDDPLSYDALDFASLEQGSNIVLRCITHAGELWLAGHNGWEVWYNSGDADFPFRRRQTGGVIEYGVGTPRSIAQIDGSVFWVGKEGVVFRSAGYQAERVSTHAIEAIIAGFGIFATNEVVGMAYSQGGHAVYVMTIDASRSLAYDCATKMWHDRSSDALGNGPWRVNCCANIENVVYGGDRVNGNVYFIDPTSPTDNGGAILRQAIFPPLYGGTRRAFCSRVEVEMEVGDPFGAETLTLDWSDDGGLTWNGGPRGLSIGTIGQYRHRVFATRLGSFRQRVFRLSTVGHGTFYAMDADIAAGVS